MSDPVTIFEARRVITMNPSRPFATHVAVRNGRVLLAGSQGDMEAFPGATVEHRFRDKVLMPGFVEGHAHVMEGAVWQKTYVGAFDRTTPDGRHVPGLQSIDDIVARLNAASDAIGDPESLLYAWGYDPLHVAGASLTRHDLDRVSTTRPVMVHHASLHIIVANSFLLKLIGFDAGTSIDGVPKL